MEVGLRNVNALGGLLLERGHELRQAVLGPHAHAAHVLHAGGDVGVALARHHGMGGDPDGLQRRRAVAVHRRAGHAVGQPRQEHEDPTDVERLLALRNAAAADQVLDRVGRDLGIALEQLVDHIGAEVVGADRGERALERAADGRAHGVDDHCVWHLRRPPEGIYCGGRE